MTSPSNDGLGTENLASDGRQRTNSLLEGRGDPVMRHRIARAVRGRDRPEFDEAELNWLSRLFPGRTETPPELDEEPVADTAPPVQAMPVAGQEDHAQAPETEYEAEAPPEPEAHRQPDASSEDDGDRVPRPAYRAAWTIAGCALAGTAIAAALAFSMPQNYRATTELIVDPREWRVADGEGGRGLPATEAGSVLLDNKMRVLASRPVLAATVERLNLASDREFNGEGGFAPWMALEALRGLVTTSDGPTVGDRRQMTATEALSRRLQISRGDRALVIEVGVDSSSAEKSALIANTLTEAFLDTYERMSEDASGRVSNRHATRLEDLRAGLEEAERAVETFKAENGLVDAQGRLISDDELVRLNDRHAEARARTVELNARASAARDADVEAVVGGTLPEHVATSALSELRSRHLTLQQAADRIATRLGPRHPERIAAQSELDRLSSQIQAELSRIAAASRAELRAAVETEQELATELARLKARQGTLGGDMVRLRELEREATARRNVYEAFLESARGGGTAGLTGTANIAVLADAVAPLHPSGPSRTAMTLAGSLLGLLAGAAIAGLRGVRRRRDEEEHLALPRDDEQVDGSLADVDGAEQEEAPGREAAGTPSTHETKQPEEANTMNRDPRQGPPPNQPHDAPHWAPAQAAPQWQQYPGHPAQYGHPAAHAMPPFHPGYWQGPPAYPAPAPAYMPQGYQPAYGMMPQPAYPGVPPQHHWSSPNQAWQPQAMPHDPAFAGPFGQQHAPAPDAQQPAAETVENGGQDDLNQRIEEIRDSLREFRDALEFLADSQEQRRRYGA